MPANIGGAPLPVTTGGSGPTEARAAVPVYVVNSPGPVGGAARRVVVVTSGPVEGGPAIPVYNAGAGGSISAEPALPVYVVSGSLGGSAPSSFATFRAALAQAATTPVDVVAIGDSITEGYIAATRWTGGYVGLLRTYYQGLYGDGGWGFIPAYHVGATYPYPWVYAGTWSTHTPAGGKFGPFDLIRWANGTGNTATIVTPACDAFDIHVTENTFTNGGIVAVTVDGGAATNFTLVTGPATYRYRKLTISGLSLATHTVVITAPATNFVFINGIMCRTGTGGVRFSNIGRNGTVTGDYAADATNVEWVSAIAPKLTIVHYTTNDFAVQTALATYETQLTRVVAQGKLTGDVLCIGANPRNAALAIPQSTYHTSLQTVATANGAGQILDFLALWVSNANQLAQGWCTDGIHPTDSGHLQAKNTIVPILGG